VGALAKKNQSLVTDTCAYQILEGVGEDGGPCKVRQISVGDCGGGGGLPGDYV